MPVDPSRDHPAVRNPSASHQVLRLLFREHALGIGFYVCSVPERSGNALLGLAVLVSSLAWSYWNPILVRTGPGRWNPGVFEGVLLYVAATGIANLLRFAFGQMPLGW